MASLRKYVGLDVGGTTMKAAVVDDRGQAATSVSMPTEPEKGQEHGLETMCETIRRAVATAELTMDDICAVGVATPGLMDIKRGLILDPPNLKPWRNVEIPKTIAAKLGKPTAFQNDANAAAMGEFWVGAGLGVSSLVMFTLGTGIGGGIIIDEKVLEGEHSHGAELGHLRIELPDRGRLCGCGRRGCLEAYASATGVMGRTRDALAETDEPTLLRKMLDEEDPGEEGAELTAKEIFDAADAGDAFARRIVEDTAFYLALGACAMLTTVDPEMIVFGGGMTAAGKPFLAAIKENVWRYGLEYPAHQVEIRFAKLGSDAGFIGAAACARQLVLAPPQ